VFPFDVSRSPRLMSAGDAEEQSNLLDRERPDNEQDETEKVPLPAEHSSTAPVLAWNSLVAFLADVEPIPAAGIAGIIVIFVLTIFGSIGALVVGFLGGALLHASVDKRKEEASWKDRLRSHLLRSETEVPKQREVKLPLSHHF